jgi:hypothetical protein
MDCVILLHFGGSITEQFELVCMRCQMLIWMTILPACMDIRPTGACKHLGPRRYVSVINDNH